MALEASDGSMAAGRPAGPLIETGPTKRPFEAETREAMASVRGALGALVAELPVEIRRPRELQRALGVDYKICWQVFNVIQADDPLTAAKHTPSAPALKRFLASGLKLGVKKARVDAVQSAIEQFGRVVHRHADDRNMFQSMVAAVASDDGDAAQELQHRRAAYRSMSQIWGAQTEAYLAASFVRKSDSTDSLDECTVTVKQGFRRLRPSASPIVYGTRDSADAEPTSSYRQIPLDPKSARKYQAPLLPEYCSRPLPKLRTEPGGAGWIYTKLATEGIGRQSRADLAFGVMMRGVPYALDTDGARLVRAGTTFRTPTALHVIDFLIHRPSFGNVKPEVIAFQSMPSDESPMVAREAPQLTVTEKVVELGRADMVLGTPEWPRYPELLQMAAGVLKWDLAEFDVLRLRVQYPVFGSVVRVQFNPD